MGVGVAGEFGQELGPTDVDLRRDYFRVVAEALEIAVLEGDDRAAARGGREGQLNFGQEIGVVGEAAVELPAEQEARRRLPGEHLAPVRLDAFGVALEPAAARAGLDDDRHMRRFADSSVRPATIAPSAREQLEGAFGRGLDGHALDDWGDAHGDASSWAWLSAKSLNASSAALHSASSHSRMQTPSLLRRAKPPRGRSSTIVRLFSIRPVESSAFRLRRRLP